MVLQNRQAGALEVIATTAVPWTALDLLLSRLDAAFAGVPPSRLVIGSGLAAAGALRIAQLLFALRQYLRQHGPVKVFFAAVKALPVVHGIVQREKAKLIGKMDTDMKAKLAEGPPKITELPKSGVPAHQVMAEVLRRREKDFQWEGAGSRMSGAVYIGDDAHFELLSKVYAECAHVNPLHCDAFPAIPRMEAEIVAMTAAMLGGGDAPGSNPSVCGLTTSGGTESILTAIRATRDYMRRVRGVMRPEMIVATSAHAAVYKAAEYFGIHLVRVGVDADMRMDVRRARRACNANTILIYASAPGYPHGAMDPIAELAVLARRRKVCLHVDACLGGFILPFAAEAGVLGAAPSTPFDFRLEGVTSMSVDTHKYGLAQKGSSVVLYSSSALRQCQYTAVSEWSGGVYISPSQAGSRAGGLIAQTWAAMMHVGRQGYATQAEQVLRAAAALREGIAKVHGLRLLGRDLTMVVGWGTTEEEKDVDIYVVNDVMCRNGWHLSVLHAPPGLHYCVTAANAAAVPQLVEDLAAATAEARELGRRGVEGGKAPIYGLAGGLPDRTAVGDLLKDVQDLMLNNA